MTFVLFDLNKFKVINDTYGHHEGDYVLTLFAQAMLDSFRECDVIARLGGDEFVVMIVDCDNNKMNIILERFKAAVENVNATSNKPYKIEYSTGVAHFPCDTDKSIEEMLQKADGAMYKDKQGKGR